jgi:hypothetical protein
MREVKSNSGQALLLVLLTMAVAIVVVLSVVSKSVTDVTITSTEEESLKAFSAAEAGIEESLLNVVPQAVSGSVDSSVNYNVVLTQETAGSSFNYPEQLGSGDTGTIWFVSHDSNGVLTCASGMICTRTNNMYLYWGTSSGQQKPAVEITFFYDPNRRSFLHSGNSSINYSGLQARTFAFDPDSTRLGQNGFALAETGSYPVSYGQTTVNYKYRIGIVNLNSNINGCVNSNNNCLVLAKVRLLYNDLPEGFGVSIQGGGAGEQLPAQGYKVSSTGSAAGGSVTRKVEVFQGYPEPPSIFDSVLFSLRGLER